MDNPQTPASPTPQVSWLFGMRFSINLRQSTSQMFGKSWSETALLTKRRWNAINSLSSIRPLTVITLRPMSCSRNFAMKGVMQQVAFKLECSMSLEKVWGLSCFSHILEWYLSTPKICFVWNKTAGLPFSLRDAHKYFDKACQSGSNEGCNNAG